MADQLVTMKVETQYRSAVQGYLEVERALAKVGNAGGQAGAQAAQGATATGNAWLNAANQLNPFRNGLSGILTASTAVYSGIAAISAAMQRQQEIKSTALESFKEWVPSLYQARINAGSFANSPEFLKTLKRGAENIGENQPTSAIKLFEGIYGAAGADATDAMKLDAYLRTSELVGAIHMEPDAGNRFGRAMMDLSGVARRQGRPMDLEQLGGLWLSNMKNSRPTEIASEAQFGTRGVANVVGTRNMSVGEGLAQQSTLSILGPDERARISSHALAGFWNEVDKAYADTMAMKKGQGRRNTFKDAPTVAAFAALPLETQWEHLQGDSQQSIALRARLEGNRSSEPRVRKYAQKHDFGNGSYSGDAIMEKWALGYLHPDSTTFKLYQATLAAQPSPEEARKYWRNYVDGKLKALVDKAAAMLKNTQGAHAGVELERMDQAMQGLVVQGVQDKSLQAGLGWLASLTRDIVAKWQTTGKMPEELPALDVKAAKRAIGDVEQKYLKNLRPPFPEFHTWLSSKYPDEAVKNRPDMAMDFRTAKPGRFQEWLRSRMTEQDLGKIESWERQINRIEHDVERSGEDYAPVEPGYAVRRRGSSLLPATRLMQRYGVPNRQGQMMRAPDPEVEIPAPRYPRADDSRYDPLHDKLDRLADTMQQMASNERNRSLDIQVDDKSGRPLTRATSRPRAIEQFYDDRFTG